MISVDDITAINTRLAAALAPATVWVHSLNRTGGENLIRIYEGWVKATAADGTVSTLPWTITFNGSDVPDVSVVKGQSSSAAISVPKSHFHAVAPFSESAPFSNGPLIWGSVWSAESSFCGVKLILENYDTQNPLVITGLYVAAQANADKTALPMRDASNGSSWLPVSYQGAPITNLSIPPAIADKQGSILITDTVYVRSVPRIDGSPQCLLNVQVKSTNASGVVSRTIYGSLNGGDMKGFNDAINRKFASYTLASGDVGQSHIEDDVTLANNSPVRGAIFISPNPGYTLLTPGDSLWCGAYGSPEGYQSTGLYAAEALSTDTTPVGFVGTAWGGMDTTTFFANGRRMFDAVNPKLVIMPCGSPNDNGGPMDIHAQLTEALEFYEYCTSRGALVVMSTAFPWSVQGAVSIYQTAELSAAVRALGIPTLDAEFLLSGVIPTPGTQTTVLDKYRGADGVHLNDDGYKMLGTEAAKILRKLAGL